MTADSLIDPDSAEKIGTVVAVATGEVYRRDWQRWAAAVGDHNPLWFEPDYARKHGYRDIVCPPCSSSNRLRAIFSERSVNVDMAPVVPVNGTRVIHQTARTNDQPTGCHRPVSCDATMASITIMFRTESSSGVGTSPPSRIARENRSP